MHSETTLEKDQNSFRILQAFPSPPYDEESLDFDSSINSKLKQSQTCYASDKRKLEIQSNPVCPKIYVDNSEYFSAPSIGRDVTRLEDPPDKATMSVGCKDIGSTHDHSGEKPTSFRSNESDRVIKHCNGNSSRKKSDEKQKGPTDDFNKRLSSSINGSDNSYKLSKQKMINHRRPRTEEFCSKNLFSREDLGKDQIDSRDIVNKRHRPSSKSTSDHYHKSKKKKDIGQMHSKEESVDIYNFSIDKDLEEGQKYSGKCYDKKKKNPREPDSVQSQNDSSQNSKKQRVSSKKHLNSRDSESDICYTVSSEGDFNKLKFTKRESIDQPRFSLGESHETSAKEEKVDINNKKVWCMMCEELIRRNHLKKHLFFGPIFCPDCGWKESNCQDFFANFSDPIRNCQHSDIKWRRNLATHMKDYFGFSDSSNHEFKKEVRKYLKLLHPLADEIPWKGAFDMCREFLHTKVKAREIIQLSSTDRYLICRKPIEICPDCYTPLPVENLTFNLETYLIDIYCSVCFLKIYIVLEESKIEILE